MDVAVTSPEVSGIDANFAVITVRITSLALILMVHSPFVDRHRGFLKMKRRTVLQLCIGGLVANALGWLLMNFSLQNIAEAQAVPISSTSPLFAVFAGLMLFREKMTFTKALSAAIIVAGIFLNLFSLTSRGIWTRRELWIRIVFYSTCVSENFKL